MTFQGRRSEIKVLHLPFCFHPDPVGGTEVYVEALARCLHERDVQVVVAAPGEREVTYEHEGLPVRRFASGSVGDLRELYGEGDPVALLGFTRTLDEEQPDLVHLHAFTRAVSLAMVREAKGRGIPVILTYHTPTVSCPRGTLMLWGDTVCDGRLDRMRCTRCLLDKHGLGQAAGAVLAGLPPGVGHLFGRLGLGGGPWTALRMSELVALRHESTGALFQEVDHVVAVCHWIRDVLLRNGVPEAKITVSRHGLPQKVIAGEPTREGAGREGSLRLAFLGRLDPTKGPEILIAALRALPQARLQLDLYGIVQGEAGADYRRRLAAQVEGDPRIRFCEPVPGDQVVSLLRNYDMLAVPSQWLETGPFVVLEASAAGIPVLGSDLGGIAEWVRDGENGLLVQPAASVEAWAGALKRLVTEPDLVARLRSGVKAPRTMDEVAEEMLCLYQQVAKKSPHRSLEERA